jgi:hypothetical protein
MQRTGGSGYGPEHYFVDTTRRSADPQRHYELRIAADLMACMRDEWAMAVHLLAIDNDCQRTGAEFEMTDWEFLIE